MRSSARPAPARLQRYPSGSFEPMWVCASRTSPPGTSSRRRANQGSRPASETIDRSAYLRLAAGRRRVCRGLASGFEESTANGWARGARRAGPGHGRARHALARSRSALRVRSGAGMIGYSITHRGRGAARPARRPGRVPRARLHLRHPAAAPVGEPALGPDLLARRAHGRARPRRTPLRLDPNGLPIHGVAGASPHWRVSGRSPGNGRVALSTRLDYSAHEELMAAFPFPHELHVQVELSGDSAHDRDDPARHRRGRGADLVRLASLPAAAGRAALGVVGRAAGAHAGRAGRARAADRARRSR